MNESHSSIRSRIAHTVRQEGPAGLIRHGWGRVTRMLTNYWHYDHYWEGRLLELLGNRARIEGVLVDVSNARIPTKDKAALLKRTYEAGERALLPLIPATLPVIELGGSIGVLACLTNRRMASPEQHLVLEADPDLIPVLERNRALNAGKFSIINAAIAYGAPTVRFYRQAKFLAGSITQPTDHYVEVAAVTLSDLARRASFEQFALICDIEGAEAELIERDADCLRRQVAWLIIEHHRRIVGDERLRGLHDRLHDCGLDVVQESARSVCYRNRALTYAV